MLIVLCTLSFLSSPWRSLYSQPLALFLTIFVAATLLVACGIADSKPSTSPPGGVDDPEELRQACDERIASIWDWKNEKSDARWIDILDGNLTVEEGNEEEGRLIGEVQEMVKELERNCDARAEELRQSANRSNGERRSSSDCDDCLSIRQLNEEYEANSFATNQRYKGTRHNFGGTVESIDQEPSVPPKPLVRVSSGGAKITFRFGWDEDYSWVLALSKGDWVKANCRISIVDNIWASGNTVTPFLDECTKAD